MFLFSQNKKPVVENAQQVKISVFIRSCILKFAENYKALYGQDIDLKDETSLKRFLDLLEKHAKLGLMQEVNGQAEYSESNPVRLAYTPSNLGRGFIVWFICNRCDQKVRKVYIPPSSPKCLCRVCHRLSYEKQNKARNKLVSKLLGHLDLRMSYLNSGSHKLALAAIEAQWIVDRGLKEAENRVDKLFDKEK